VNLQVSVQGTPFALPAPPRIDFLDFFGTAPRESEKIGPACVARKVLDHARIEVPVGSSGAQLQLTLTRPAQLTASLAVGRTHSMTTTFAVQANKPVFLGTTASGTTLVVGVPHGGVEACGPGVKG